MFVEIYHGKLDFESTLLCIFVCDFTELTLLHSTIHVHIICFMTKKSVMTFKLIFLITYCSIGVT